MDTPTADMLDKAWEGKPLTEVIEQSPEVLQGVTEEDAKLLEKAFGIKTVKAMAECKYFLYAVALVERSKA